MREGDLDAQAVEFVFYAAAEFPGYLPLLERRRFDDHFYGNRRVIQLINPQDSRLFQDDAFVFLLQGGIIPIDAVKIPDLMTPDVPIKSHGVF